uniref:Arylamine N-acetyltransferase 2 n=1 Tax=Heterostelium pallidum TaxID=13642 RepID=D8FSX7_HETPA|nr:TPA: arylamine N-acetyltransferase 2 [Heterostelium pallidum]
MAILSISKNDNNNNNNNSNTEFQKLFLRRINIDENKRIEFEDLPEVMRQFGLNIPFENSDVIGQEPCGITKQYLIEKVLVKNQGGLCYHLNRLMYFFLVECGFHVRQLVATVWNPVTNKSWATPNGHCIAMITYDGNDYLVDVGFGLFLALAPIPFKTVVFSRTGEYRWIPRPTEYGTHSLEWRPSPDNIQRLIHGDTHKEFNSIPLSTILLEPSQGQATISGNSFTITKPNGEKVKELISNEKRQELLETIFKFKKK